LKPTQHHALIRKLTWGVSEFRMADIGNFDSIISNRV